MQQKRLFLLLSYPCVPHRWGRPQDLSPGLSELHILRLHLTIVSLRYPLPLGADEDGWLQRLGWHPKVLNVCSLACWERLMSHLWERWKFGKKINESENTFYTSLHSVMKNDNVTLCCTVDKPVFCPHWWRAHWSSSACKYHFSQGVSCEASQDASLWVLGSSPNKHKHLKHQMFVNQR